MDALFPFTLIVCLLHIVCADDLYDQLFVSNTQECLDYQIVFDKALPEWLHGSMLRNGLGRFEMGPRRFTLALDAYAKISKVTFNSHVTRNTGTGNEARYSTTFVYSKSYVESAKKFDIQPYMVLGSMIPAFSPEETLWSLSRGLDNMNVNIVRYGNSSRNGYLILNDVWNVYEINPFNMSTIRAINPPIDGVSPYYKIVRLGSAHPLPEYGTTNHITFVSLASAIPEFSSKYLVYRATSADDREKIAEIEVDMVSYTHSFAATKNYAIIFSAPLFVDPIAILKVLKAIDGFVWSPEKKTKLHVVNLKTGFVETFETDPMFFLHHANAFEDIFGNLVMDVAAYDDGRGVLSTFKLENLYNTSIRSSFIQPHLRRYTINKEAKTVDVTSLNIGPSLFPYAANLEFPIINEHYRFERYCYVYGIVYNVNGSDFLDMALVKKDICSATKDKAWYQNGVILNEPIFVPTPGAVTEDDGYLLVDILDTTKKTSYMLIFNAGNLTLANSAKLPVANPFGTHGRFFDDVV